MKRNILTGVLILIILAGAVYVNQMNTKHPGYSNAGDGDDDDDLLPQTQASQQATPPPPPPSAATGQHTAAGNATSAASAEPPSELTLGNPSTAKTKVTIGYTLDEKSLANETPLNTVIGEASAWQKAHPNDSVQVVNVDVPASERSDPSTASVPVGVNISGGANVHLNGNPGQGAVNPGTVGAALMAAK